METFTYGQALEQGIPLPKYCRTFLFRAMRLKSVILARNYDESFHGPVRCERLWLVPIYISGLFAFGANRAGSSAPSSSTLGFSFLTKPASYYGLGLSWGERKLLFSVDAGLFNHSPMGFI